MAVQVQINTQQAQQQVNALTAAFQQLRTGATGLQTGFNQLTTVNATLTAQHKNLTTTASAAAKSLTSLTTAMQNNKTTLTQNTNSLNTNTAANAKNTASIRNNQAAVASLTASFAKLTPMITALSTTIAAANAALTAQTAIITSNAGATTRAAASAGVMTQSMRSLHAAARGASGAMGSLWLTYGQTILPMVTAFAAVGSAMQIFKKGTEFEWLNTFSSSLSEGAVSAGKLNEKLLEMKGVGQTPTQLAKGFLELQKAGQSVSASLENIGTVSKYSAVAQLDLGQATEQLVTITTAFEKTSKGAAGGMLTVADTADIVAYSAQKSTASFSDMQVAFRYMTGTASTAGFSIQEVASALMVMANHGLKGSMGATSLRTAFERLINPTHKASELFKAAGGNLSAIYEDGQFQGIQSIGKELERLKNTMSARSWSEFSFQTFGMRGMQVNALVTDIANLDKNLKNIAESAGFVDRTFSQLSDTTKMKMTELAASFERAFIKAFEGEKAREVINDLNRVISDQGFATSLEHIATGAFGLTKSFVWMADKLLSLPTWVLEGGVISAFFFGMAGKLVIAGLLAAATAIDDVINKMNEAEATYKKNTEIGGEQYAKLNKQLLETETRIAAIKSQQSDTSIAGSLAGDMSGELAKELKNLDYIKSQIENYKITTKSTTADGSNSNALKSLSDFHDKKELLEEQSYIDSVKREQARTAKDIVMVNEREENKKKKAEDSHTKLMNLTSELETFNANSDNKTLGTRLENISKYENAQELFIKNSSATEAEKEKALLELHKKTTTQIQQANEEQAKKDEDKASKRLLLEEKLNSEIGLSDDIRLARKLSKLDEEYYKTVETIKKTYDAEKESYELEEAMDKAFHDNAIQRGELMTQQRIKEADAIRDFNTELREMASDAGVGGLSELDKELADIQDKFDKMLGKLKKDGVSGEEFDEAAKQAAKLRKEMEDIAKAKLGDDIFAGFIAGLKESQREAITLGKIGAELGRTFTSELATTFKDIFTGSNENKYADEMVTISEKIKQMQYESLEGGLAQLEWLRKEYDASLEGAMSGNEDMFQQYTSNLDEYLAKAKENMSPEEYAEVYAKTMDDLNKLNEEYADNTESTWERISDSFGDMADRILDKFMDMIAQMAAQDLMNIVLDSTPGVTTSGGNSTTNTITSAINSIDWSWLSDSSSSGMDSTWGDNGDYTFADGGVTGYGKLQGGSGTTDDLYLGKVNGKRVLAKGGEYIMPPEQTNKYLPMLEQMRTGAALAFADGGMTSSRRATSSGNMSLEDLISLFRQLSENGFMSVDAMRELTKTTHQVTDANSRETEVKDKSLQTTQASTQAIQSSTQVSKTHTQTTKSFAQSVEDATTKTFNSIATSKALGLAIGALASATSPVIGILGILGYNMAKDTELGKELGKAFGSLGEVVGDLVGGVVGAVAEIGSAVADMVGFAGAAQEASQSMGFAQFDYDASEFSTDYSYGYLDNSWSPGMNPDNNAHGMLGDPDIDSRDRTDDTTPGGLLGDWGGGNENDNDQDSGNAKGGWLGKYGSGWINQGNGYEDDVYLGTMGNTNSYGMGGEFVVNKRSAAKYAGLLEMVNKDYADGGTIGPSYLEASVLAGSALSQYNSQITVITDDMEDNLRDIAKITEDVIYTFITETMDDLTKEIFDLNKSYDEQVKELKDLEAAESDYALVEQARNLELNKIQEEYNKEQLETAKEMADELADMMYDIRYDLRVGTLEDFQQSIQGIWETQKETVAKLKELGASFEEIREAVSLTWRKINEELLQQAKDELTDATQVLKDAFSAEKDSITTRYEEVMKGLNEQLSLANEKVSELEGIISALDSALDTLKGSDVLQENTFRTAQADLRRRGLSGDISEGLDKTLSEAVKFSTDYYSTGADYKIALKKSVGFTENLKDLATEQLTTAEAQVATIEAQIEMEEASYNAMIASLDSQLNSLLGIETTVMSIADAIAMYNKASAAVSAVAGSGGGGTTFNTSDYIQAKAESLVKGGWATSVEEAANMFLQALTKDGVTPYQHYQQWGEMENVYGLSSRDSAMSPTQYGSGSFNTADYIQAKATSLFDSGYAVSIESAKEAFLTAIAKDSVTPEQHFAAWGASEGIYSFATGGSFSVDGPSGIDNLAIPNVRLTAGEVVNVTSGDTMKELKEELAALRQVMAAIVSNTAVTAKQLSRWDGDGMPDVRVV